jgi:hypothetical protein
MAGKVSPRPGSPARRLPLRGKEGNVPLVKWQYHIEMINISERWSAKRQAEEVENFRTYLNNMGAEGWEMISYESVPLTGHFTEKVKGYAYLTFFKRQVA